MTNAEILARFRECKRLAEPPEPEKNNPATEDGVIGVLTDQPEDGQC